MAVRKPNRLAFLYKVLGLIAILSTSEPSPLNHRRNSFVLKVSANFFADDYSNYIPATQSYTSPQRYYPQILAESESNAKKATAIKLTKSRINDAQIYLAEVSESPNLIGDCPKQLDAVDTGLSQAARSMGEEGGEDAAARALDAVEAILDDCIETMARIQTPASRETRATLRQVARSVSSAEKFLEIANPGAGQSGSADDKSEEGAGTDSSSGDINIPAEAQPIKNLVVDFCPNHVTISGSTATIRLDKACGGKFHSQEQYSSGVFTAVMRTPVKATGISNSFYISSNDQASDVISFDFLGNHPSRIVTNYAVSGNSVGNQQVIVVSFDTSVKFHTYTIKWDAVSIVWLVDNIVLRSVSKAEAGAAYPSKPGSIYGYSWDASTVANGAYSGTVDWATAPFSMYFDSLTVISPLAPGTWRLPAHPATSSNVPVPMRPLAIDYCANNVVAAASELSIAYDASGCGGRFRSLQRYASGSFSGNVRCASGDTSGLLSSLYLSSKEGSRTQDEIDFEWLGNNKQGVQTNFYVDGVGGHEVWVDLGFDCSQAAHTYTVAYTGQQIQWLVDNKVVRTVTQAQQQAANRPYPVKPVFFYASVWNASGVNNGGWAGKWHGRDLPFVVRYNDVTIQGQPLPADVS